jgi:hypothetical protein
VVFAAYIYGRWIGGKAERWKICAYLFTRGQHDLGSFKIIDIGKEIAERCHWFGPPKPDLLKERCDAERAMKQALRDEGKHA